MKARLLHIRLTGSALRELSPSSVRHSSIGTWTTACNYNYSSGVCQREVVCNLCCSRLVFRILTLACILLYLMPVKVM
jgi:hypothetical protein